MEVENTMTEVAMASVTLNLMVAEQAAYLIESNVVVEGQVASLVESNVMVAERATSVVESHILPSLGAPIQLPDILVHSQRCA